MNATSQAIRNLELMSMNPETANKIEAGLARCPKCGGFGEEKMDALPKVVCVDCRMMFDPNGPSDFRVDWKRTDE